MNLIKKTIVILGAFIAKVQPLYSEAPYFRNESRPLVLAHRGDMGWFPEHTEGAYTGAYFANVDFVELDLQITKDGHLICSHDPTLRETTNIMKYYDQYQNLMGNWTFGPPYDFTHENDFLIHDFTLAELKQLKRKQRFEDRNQYLNEIFTFMTLEEVIELMLKMNKEHPTKDRKHPIGLYIETKMYKFYKQNYGIDSAEMVINTLHKYGLDSVEKSKDKLPIILECFEIESLQKMQELKNDLPRIFLTKQDIHSLIKELKEISQVAHGIGPKQQLVFQQGSILPFMARRYRLELHPWTIRDDQLQFTKTPQDENMVFYHARVGGVFTEFPHMTMSVFEKQVIDQQRKSVN